MSIQVGILTLIDTSCMFALFFLAFCCRLLHIVFDVFPQYIAFGKFFENVIPVCGKSVVLGPNVTK